MLLVRTVDETVDFAFEPGRNCWRVEPARRVAPLIDAEAYFSALYDALCRARRRICIAGWDIDSQVQLIRDEPGDPLTRLGPLLDALARANPALRVYILAWDFSPIYLLEREPFPRLKFGMRTHHRVHFALDDTHPAGASHHQKVVVIDDDVAFCGGLDLCDVRWDTAEHAMPDARRVDVNGRPYRPHHDVQVALDGPVAAALGHMFAHRWHRVTSQRLEPLAAGEGHAWPPRLAGELENIPVGIARTFGKSDNGTIREVEQLWLDAIASARESIYIETCYLTAPALVDAMAARLSEPDGPRIVITTGSEYGGWLEDWTMGVLRNRCLDALLEADRHGHLVTLAPRVWDPENEEEVTIKIHGKVLVVDDALLRIGSSNATRRSLSLDTECDVAMIARTEAERRTIARFRRRLLAEHLGCGDDRIERELEAAAGGCPGPSASRPRGCRPLERQEQGFTARLLEDGALVDPESPLRASQVWRLMLQTTDRSKLVNRVAWVWWTLVVAAAATVTISGAVDGADLIAWISVASASPWAGPVTLAAYVVGGLVLVPVTLLIVATGVVFGPFEGLAYALLGAFTSAAVYYWLGRWMGRGLVYRVAGPRLRAATKAVARRGLLAVAAVRLVPIAPHVVVGIAAGAARVSFRDYMLGTIVAMAPGSAVLVIVGDQLESGLQSPHWSTLLVAGSILVVGLAIAWALQRWLGQGDRLHTRADRDEAPLPPT